MPSDEEYGGDNAESNPVATSYTMAAVWIITRFLENNNVDSSVINSVLMRESEIVRLILSKRVRLTKVTEFFFYL